MQLRNVFIIIFVCCFGFSMVGCKQDKVTKLSDSVILCKKLKIGMTYDQVVKIMGQPINKAQIEVELKIKDVLIFNSPRLASTFNQCVLDRQSGLVEEIVCGEDYRLTK